MRQDFYSIIFLQFLNLFPPSLLIPLKNPNGPQVIDYVKPDAEHRLRHRRFIKQHFHDLDVMQKAMKRQLDDLRHHRFSERLQKLEVEQKRLANTNFNISRQVSSLDRLHGSMLELLEDIEGIQNKFDKTIPDIKREISKVEFNAAQVASEYRLLREEGHNAANSIQALVVTVSTLQDEHDVVKKMEQTMHELKHNVTKLQSAAMAHRHMFHKRIEKVNKLCILASIDFLHGIRIAASECRTSKRFFILAIRRGINNICIHSVLISISHCHVPPAALANRLNWTLNQTRNNTEPPQMKC